VKSPRLKAIARYFKLWYSPIPGSILLPTILFNSSMIVHLHNLVTCCTTLMYSHRVGPEYHICQVDEQIPLLAILLNLPLWRTQCTPFQSTCYVMTVNAIRVSSEISDYVLTSWSKDGAVTLLTLQREHHGTIFLQLLLWVMSIMALSTSGTISSSIGCNAP
jgi:hypothetical protein